MYGLADLQGEARDPRLLLDQAHTGVALKGAHRVPTPVVEARPTASATLELVGRPEHRPRHYAVRLMLRFTGIEPKFADHDWVVRVAQSAFAAASKSTVHEPPKFDDIYGTTNNIIGVEGVMVCVDLPMELFFAQLREVLVAAGYGVAVRELRTCSESGCATTAVIDCVRSGAVPNGWHAEEVCGRHGYKTCDHCRSTYVMSSSNATGAAPSVPCEVCGELLVEWGRTKLWTAELVARAEWPRAP